MDFISALRERGVPEEIEFDYTWLHAQGRYIVLYKVADQQPPSQVSNTYV